VVVCWQWRIAYLFSVAYSLDDDSCMALIEAVKEVFEDCGIQIYQPASEHFLSSADYEIHAEEMLKEIQKKSRSEC